MSLLLLQLVNIVTLSLSILACPALLFSSFYLRPNISLFCIFLSVHSPHSGCPGPWPCVHLSQLHSWWPHAAYPHCGTSNTNIHMKRQPWGRTFQLNVVMKICVQQWACADVRTHCLSCTLQFNAWLIEIMWVLWNLLRIPLIRQLRHFTYLDQCVGIDLCSLTACLDALQTGQRRNTGSDWFKVLCSWTTWSQSWITHLTLTLKTKRESFVRWDEGKNGNFLCWLWELNLMGQCSYVYYYSLFK